LKNSLFVPISQNLRDRKCLGDPRKSIVGLPDAILFLSILREGVFQQPQAFTLIDLLAAAALPLNELFPNFARYGVVCGLRAGRLFVLKPVQKLGQTFKKTYDQVSLG
jgi:hypothetical protein